MDRNPGMRPPFRGQFNQGNQYQSQFQKNNNSSFYVFQPRPPANPQVYQATEFDGKRLRKAIARKTVDYNSSTVKLLESRVWQRDSRDSRLLQPDVGYYTELQPPFAILDNPVNCITTKFVRTSTNKMRCPIFCVLWTPEGRRLVTGASSGEFTLWNGLTFNFETILQAHDSPVRVMNWSRNDSWMVTADHKGYVKYWQSNMNNVKMFEAHKEPVRALSFCPTDMKFATCSDDGTVRIFDFLRCKEERIMRGHGADVKGVDWHPTKGLVVSGSKDTQQPIKLWDPKTGQSLATIHAHKATVTDVKWNKNGNWLLTASRDHLIKIFDIRNLSQEMQTFRGHKKEAYCLAWHPVHESLFASGGTDGSILFWSVGTEKEVGGMEQAHDSTVWSLSWHPLGHILASGSNDHTCKFWTRNRPGDRMRDKYNLNLLPKGQEEEEYNEIEATPAIPGFGEHLEPEPSPVHKPNSFIPGLEGDRGHHKGAQGMDDYHNSYNKKPFSKPVSKQFQDRWLDRNGPPPMMNNRSAPPPMMDAMPPRGPPPRPNEIRGPPPNFMRENREFPRFQNQPHQNNERFAGPPGLPPHMRPDPQFTNRTASPTPMKPDNIPESFQPFDRDERFVPAHNNEPVRRFAPEPRRNSPVDWRQSNQGDPRMRSFPPNQPQQQFPQQMNNFDMRDRQEPIWQREQGDNGRGYEARQHQGDNWQQNQAPSGMPENNNAFGGGGNGAVEGFAPDQVDPRKRQWQDGPGYDRRPDASWNRGPDEGREGQFNRRF